MTGAQTNGVKRKSIRHVLDPDDDAPAPKKTKAQQPPKNASQSSVRTRSKRAYDEDDDGFIFSKKPKPNKSKTAPAPSAEPQSQPSQQPLADHVAPSQQPPLEHVAPSEPAPPPKKKPRKTLPTTPEHNAPRRRSKRLSGNSPSVQVVAKTAPPEKPKRKSTAPPNKEKPQSTPPPATESAPTEPSPPLEDDDLTVDKKREPAKIPLPFGETPVLRRNKEMRKVSAEKSRRSSSGMRGRRASSLIEAGSSRDSDLNVEAENQESESNNEDDIAQSDRSDSREDYNESVTENKADQDDSLGAAVPHSQVETPEFYKHISQDLIEPKRMRQLLMWSGHRALPEKGGGQMDAAETAAMHAARVIQEELLNEFGTRGDTSYWYDREDTAPAVLVKKPNPRNIQNAQKLPQLEAELARLQEEKRSWETLLASTSGKKDEELGTFQKPMALEASTIDSSLLDPSQTEALQTLLSNMALDSGEQQGPQTQALDTLTNTRQRIGGVAQSLEFKIDTLADGAHRLEQYRQTAERLADQVLGAGAQKLEEKETKLRDRTGGAVDAMDKLRGLSRVLNRKAKGVP